MQKEGRTHNKVLPKAGLNGFDWTFVQGLTFVLRLNFCAKNPRLRQYPNRWLISHGHTLTKKHLIAKWHYTVNMKVSK